MAKLLNDEQHKFLIDNYKGKGNKELTDLINDKFNTNFSTEQIKHYKNNRHLDSGLTGRFEKGQTSWNKGMKWNEFMSEQGMENSKKGWYKKGHDPANMDAIGTEKWKSPHQKYDDVGFIYVKIQDKKGRFNWKQKHRLIWEETYGPIPLGYKVIFKDGDRSNVVLENLALVSNSQMLILNKRKLIYEKKELTESGIVLAKYIDTVNKKCKKK